MKKRRIFICCQAVFPRGSAASNYVQYFSLALLQQNYEVFVLSDINEEYRKELEQNDYYYKGIKVIETKMSGFKPLHYIQYHYFIDSVFSKILSKKNIGSDDLILVYSHISQIHKWAIEYAKKSHCKTACCMVEWFPREYYKNKKDYEKAEYDIRNIRTHHNLVFPISSFIDEFFQSQGTRTLLLPIMADTEEFQYKAKNTDKIRFIYSGNRMMKDKLAEMIKAFLQLPEDDKKRIELHICGTKEAVIDEICNGKLKENPFIIVHKWMEYADLIALYQNMHYLFIAREENQMTLANFPSKVPECMGYGIVPVVSDVGDYTKFYLTDGKDSIIFNGYNENNCLQAIKRAMDCFDKEFKLMSANAVDTVKSRFDYRVWSLKISKTIEGLYEE